ncbi:hypothetical protein LCGC14_0947450 [marine sediment metagenome]|uniref:Uncharacterized protein n=1 Tax=marine sediment metagenome TaxID=412755 RepID=A0A0F9NIG7_9ZZZZ
MDKIICPYCSKVNKIIWAPIFSFVISWLHTKPRAIITYYKCPECEVMLSISTRVS